MLVTGTGTAQARVNAVLLSNPYYSIDTGSGLSCAGISSVNGASHQGWYDNAIAVNPLNRDEVWVGGNSKVLDFVLI